MRKTIVLLVLSLSLIGVGAAKATTYGAWTSYYQYGLSAPAGSHLGYAIVAVKRELAYNGCLGGMVIDQPTFGDAARNSAICFQRSVAIGADGVVGPTTARYLFRKRGAALERTGAIPDSILQRIKTLESANDPNAIGYVDHNDHGLMQINLFYHPDISIPEAIDPAFAIEWGQDHLLGDYGSTHDWDGAIAAHNIGLFYAKRWVEAGKPPSGYITSTGKDIFEVATNYVKLVRRQPL